MYIDTVTGDYPLTANDIKSRLPNTLFSEPFAPPAGYAEVKQTPMPDWNPVIERIVEGAPELVSGEWKRTWIIEKIYSTPSQEAAALAEHEAKALVAWREQTTCTPFQGRQALRGAGLFSQVEAFMALPETSDTAKDLWEYAIEWKRTSPMIASLAAALNMTDAQVDDLFKSAALITA